MSLRNRCHLKVAEAAAYLGISKNTLRKYTDEGRIKAKRLPGGDRLYSTEWLDEFIADLPDEVEAPREDGSDLGYNDRQIRPVLDAPNERRYQDGN